MYTRRHRFKEKMFVRNDKQNSSLLSHDYQLGFTFFTLHGCFAVEVLLVLEK